MYYLFLSYIIQIKFHVVTIYTVDTKTILVVHSHDHLHKKSIRNFVKHDLVSVNKICISACLNVE